MPRRPKSRQARPSAQQAKLKTKASEQAEVSEEKAKPSENDQDLQEQDDFSYDMEEASEGGEEDADAPRIVQWIDDDNEWEQEVVAGPSKLNVQKDLSSLSMGSLRTAQRTLMQAEALDSSDEEMEDAPKAGPSKGKHREEAEWDAHPKPIIQPRANKHAPIEVTSKRPVSRKRTVVEVKTVQSRDPRFLPLAGEFSPDKFHKNYAFISESHQSELGTLRENLKRARKLVQSSPKNLRAEREEEVARLERAIKRAESEVNKDRRTQVEREALGRLKKEEKAKREQGKGSWYMKDAEKKQHLTKARYDALAASGGERAVKKVIERKQKKIGQKERKSRPFGKRKAGDERGGEERYNKRRRVE